MKLLPFKLYHILVEFKHQESKSSVGLESMVGTSFFFDVFLKLRGFAHPLFLGSKYGIYPHPLEIVISFAQCLNDSIIKSGSIFTPLLLTFYL